MLAVAAAVALVVLAIGAHSALVGEDAVHVAMDLGTLALGVAARRFAEHGPDERNTFGWHRVDAFVGATLALALTLASVWGVVVQARAATPSTVAVLVVAGVLSLAPAAPLIVQAWLHRTSGTARALGLHGLADLAAGVATLVAASLTQTRLGHDAQTAAAAIIAATIAATSWRMIRDAVALSLDLAPRGVAPSAVRATIEATPGVIAAHHLHLWRLDEQTSALSAHIVARSGLSLHETQLLADTIRQRLARAHGITHATLEFECHACEAASHGASTSSHDQAAPHGLPPANRRS